MAFHRGRFLAQLFFLLFINDISSFAVEACVLNICMLAMLSFYTSETSTDELECRLQVCIDNISNWHSMNKRCVDNKKSNVMVIGSIWQLK